jgi:hypothetical protein
VDLNFSLAQTRFRHAIHASTLIWAFIMTQVKYSFNKNHNIHAFLYTYHSTSMQMNLHTYEFVGVIIWRLCEFPTYFHISKKSKIQNLSNIYCKNTSWNSYEPPKWLWSKLIKVFIAKAQVGTHRDLWSDCGSNQLMCNKFSYLY